MEIRIIRHGPKQKDRVHLTGAEAELNPDLIYLVENYAKAVAQSIDGKTKIVTPTLPRNYQTAEIITDVLLQNGVDVTGPTIEDRISFFTGKDGRVILSSPKIRKLWGEAEKNYQTVEGVGKEDRGMYAIAELGIDFDYGDGITLEEGAYRIGDYILENIENIDQGDQTNYIIGVSNSGVIEPFIYATLRMIEGQGTTDVGYFKRTGGALKPLTGIRIEYEKRSPTMALVLPNSEIIVLEKDVLQDQRTWLKDHGKKEEILRMRAQEQ